MKVIKLEHGIQLKPENDFERECLKHIHGKSLTPKFEDEWDRKGDMRLEFKPHPWDKDGR